MSVMNLQAWHLHLMPEKDLRPDLNLARVLAVLQHNGNAAQSSVPWNRMDWRP